MPKTETGMLCIVLTPNDPSLGPIRIEFDRRIGCESAVAGWLAKKMTELDHPGQFSSKELLEAPWAPTQTSLFDQTYFHSLEELAIQAFPGQVWTLSGELGAGKTVFTQGFAKGLGLTEPVSSPTFTILQIYEEGRLPMYHFDLYRIGDPEELFEIGCEEYFYGQGVCLIEWADLIEEILPEDTKFIYIQYGEKEGERIYQCTF